MFARSLKYSLAAGSFYYFMSFPPIIKKKGFIHYKRGRSILCEVTKASTEISLSPMNVVYTQRTMIGLTLSEPEEGSKGLKVILVKEGSMAQVAGFKRGDLITQINDIYVSNEEQYIDALKTGGLDKTFTIKRDDHKIKLIVHTKSF